MNIRSAVAEDADAVSALIAKTAHHFMLDPTGLGAERFLQAISPQAILGYIQNPAFHYLVVDTGTEIVGAAALRDGRHLLHLFVAPDYQRQGIARELWASISVSATPSSEGFTVNSSPNAMAFYQRLGFHATGPRTEMNGIAFIPMELSIANRFRK